MHDGSRTGKTITKALIDGKVVIINLSSNDQTSYRNIARPVEYLGEGVFHSYNDVLAHDKTPTHFWRYLPEKEIQEDVSDPANTDKAIQELTAVKNALVDAYNTSLDQFYVMAMEIIDLRKQKTELIELVEKMNDPTANYHPVQIEVAEILKKYEAKSKTAQTNS